MRRLRLRALKGAVVDVVGGTAAGPVDGGTAAGELEELQARGQTKSRRRDGAADTATKATTKAAKYRKAITRTAGKQACLSQYGCAGW